MEEQSGPLGRLGIQFCPHGVEFSYLLLDVRASHIEAINLLADDDIVKEFQRFVQSRREFVITHLMLENLGIHLARTILHSLLELVNESRECAGMCGGQPLLDAEVEPFLILDVTLMMNILAAHRGDLMNVII